MRVSRVSPGAAGVHGQQTWHSARGLGYRAGFRVPGSAGFRVQGVGFDLGFLADVNRGTQSTTSAALNPKPKNPAPDPGTGH